MLHFIKATESKAANKKPDDTSAQDLVQVTGEISSTSRSDITAPSEIAAPTEKVCSRKRCYVPHAQLEAEEAFEKQLQTCHRSDTKMTVNLKKLSLLEQQQKKI